MFDRQRLADIIRHNTSGDLRDLADEVVRLSGEAVACNEEIQTAKSERDLWKTEASRATSENAALVARVAEVLDAVPKTRRGAFADVAALVER